MAEPLTFDALVSSEHVLSTAENFVVYALLEAVAKGGGANGVRLPLNLGVVIDRSGSMYDERRLEFVVEAVKFLADNVAPDDKIAVIAFADKAQVILQSDQIHDRTAVRHLTILTCSKSAAAPKWPWECAQRSTRSNGIWQPIV